MLVKNSSVYQTQSISNSISSLKSTKTNTKPTTQPHKAPLIKPAYPPPHSPTPPLKPRLLLSLRRASSQPLNPLLSRQQPNLHPHPLLPALHTLHLLLHLPYFLFLFFDFPVQCAENRNTADEKPCGEEARCRGGECANEELGDGGVAEEGGVLVWG